MTMSAAVTIRLASLRVRDFTERVRGVPLRLGLVSSVFTNAHRGDYAHCVNPVVVVAKHVVTHAHFGALLPLYEEVARTHACLVLAARDFDSEALAMLTINVQRATMSCAPLIGDAYELERLAELAATPVVDIGAGLATRGTLPGMIATVDQSVAVGDFRGAADIDVVYVGGRTAEEARARR